MGFPSDWGNYGKRMDVHVKVELNQRCQHRETVLPPGHALMACAEWQGTERFESGHAPARTSPPHIQGGGGLAVAGIRSSWKKIVPNSSAWVSLAWVQSRKRPKERWRRGLKLKKPLGRAGSGCVCLVGHRRRRPGFRPAIDRESTW